MTRVPAIFRAPALLVVLLLVCGVALVLLGHDGEGGGLLGAVVGYARGQHVGATRERRRSHGMTVAQKGTDPARAPTAPPPKEA